MTQNFDSIKLDFPLLSRSIGNRPLVYLDNAATSQKPQAVIEAIVDYYIRHNANVHRGVHTLSDESTQAFSQARQTIAHFFGAKQEELILVRNTTEAINGVAYGWADHQLQPGDLILATLMEHHSDLVVWQEACKRTGASLELTALTKEGRLDLKDLENRLKKMGSRLKLMALPHVSNALGAVNPVTRITKLIHQYAPQARVMLDAAQSAPHLRLNFHQLGVDFLAFSGHKMLGPMGCGGLLVSRQLLESGQMKPWLFGGGMIAEVTPTATKFIEDLNERFVAGTPDVASAVGLAAACQYLTQLGMKQVEQHDRTLVEYALNKLSQVKEVTIVGPSQPLPEATQLDRIGSVAFTYQGVHAHDVAQILDSQGIAVRSGHHCCQPLHTHFGWPATVRASFQIYNSKDDIDQLIAGLDQVKKVFAR